MKGVPSMNVWLRGLLRGLGYGLAIAALGTWVGMLIVMGMRLPAAPCVTLVAALFPLALGAAIGLVAAPLLRLRGRWAPAHTAFMLVAWIVLSFAFALDPRRVGTWLMGPAVGLVLFLAGARVARHVRWLPWALGATALVGAIVVPLFVYESRSKALEGTQTTGAARIAAPDVVLVVLDTVRARSVSALGYARPTTPVLERLAREGVLFTEATAPATWSLPSHASLFTGRFPSAHHAHEEHRFLSTELPTLAEVLAGAGYETRCFTANPHISGGFGLTRGYSWSDESWRGAGSASGFVLAFRMLDALGLGSQDKGGGRVADNFERWAGSRGSQPRPTFAFVNFLEAHFPYHQIPDAPLRQMSSRPEDELRAASLRTLAAQFGSRITPEEAARLRGPTIDMYDAGVLYTDHLLGRIVAAIEATGRLDSTILVVLADHGEMVGEHGQFGHEGSVHQPVLHVPLLMRYPSRIAHGARVTQPVSTLGVFASILDMADVAPPPTLQVGTLLPAMDGSPAGQPVLTERFERSRPGGPPSSLSMPDRRYRAYRSGPSKLVVTSRGDVHLFDLVADPDENRDIAASQPAEAERLRQELELWVRSLGLPPLDAATEAGPVPELDAEATERLRSLGYVE